MVIRAARKAGVDQAVTGVEELLDQTIRASLTVIHVINKPEARTHARAAVSMLRGAQSELSAAQRIENNPSKAAKKDGSPNADHMWLVADWLPKYDQRIEGIINDPNSQPKDVLKYAGLLRNLATYGLYPETKRDLSEAGRNMYLAANHLQRGRTDSAVQSMIAARRLIRAIMQRI